MNIGDPFAAVFTDWARCGGREIDMLEKIHHAKVKSSAIKTNEKCFDFFLVKELHSGGPQGTSSGVEAVIVVVCNGGTTVAFNVEEKGFVGGSERPMCQTKMDCAGFARGRRFLWVVGDLIFFFSVW